MIRTAILSTVIVLAVAVGVVVGVLSYHADAAARAHDAPADPVVTAAFEEAARAWRRNIDRPLAHRLVLTSAEEYGTGVYLFVFDIYGWFGIGSGYVAHSADPLATGCGGGGLARDGGFAGFGEIASDDGLSEARAGCTLRYGGGRVVAPIVR